MTKNWTLSEILDLSRGKRKVMEMDAATVTGLKKETQNQIKKCEGILRDLSNTPTNANTRQKLAEDIRRLQLVDGYTADQFELRNKKKHKGLASLLPDAPRYQGAFSRQS